MSVNALLVRSGLGWSEVVNVPAGRRRRERQVDLSFTTAQAIETVGLALIAQFGDVRTEVTAEVEPKTDAERAYLAYRHGDTITVPDVDGTPVAERVVSLTAEWSVESPGGHPKVTPQLRDVILTSQDAFWQALERTNRGALGGGSPAVGVPTTTTTSGDRETEPHRWGWTIAETGTVANAAPWPVPNGLRPIRVNCSTTGSVNYARLVKNGATWIDLGNGGGAESWTVTVYDLTADYGDLVAITADVSGSFHADMEWYPTPSVGSGA